MQCCRIFDILTTTLQTDTHIFAEFERRKKERRAKELVELGKYIYIYIYDRGLKMALGNSFPQFLLFVRVSSSSVGMCAIMEGRDARRN